MAINLHLLSSHMNKILTLLILLAFPHATFALDSGDSPPNFSLQSNQNQEVGPKQFSGNVLYLDFWASWCGPCKQSFPWMNAIQKEFESRGFKVLAVNLDSSKKDAERFLSENSSNLTIAFDQDGKIPELYGIHSMPSSFLIDRKGKIVAAFEGFHDEDKDKIREKIIALLNDGKE